MATPLVYVSALTFTLTQRLRSSGTDTSITASTTDDWSSVTQGGVCKLNTGSASEWFSFTGITIGSTVSGVTALTFTGVVRGLKKDASTTSDVLSGNKKNHASGTTIGKFVAHSLDINRFIQKDKDNTLSGANVVSGSITFTSTTGATLKLQRVTTTQRDALTGVTEGCLVKNDTTGLIDAYLGGVWVELGVASAPTFASETVAGTVEKATDAEFIIGTENGGTGAYLFATPKQLYGTGTAGETLARNDFVYVKASDSKLYKASQDTTSVTESFQVIGVIVVGGASSATVIFQRLDGEFTYSSAHGFTIGATLYLGTGGALTATKPSMSSSVIVPMIIATATSTTKVAFRPQRLARRKYFYQAAPLGTNLTITVGFPISHVIGNYMQYTGAAAPNLYIHLMSLYDVLGGNQSCYIYSGYFAVTYGGATIVASVNGSNNLVLTGTFGATDTLSLVAFEAL